MFNKDSILYEVNVICKMISIIIFLISLVFLKIPGMIVLLSIVLFGLSFSFKYLFRYSVFTVVIAIIASFYPPILWITKFLILINYILLINKTINFSEMRYLLETTLYKFQKRKITYRILYAIYFFNYMKKNTKILNKLRDEYGIASDSYYLQFSLKKAYEKTKHEMAELMLVNQLRFYNYSSKRTYLERPTWERWDNSYLLFHIILLIFIIIYGG